MRLDALSSMSLTGSNAGNGRATRMRSNAHNGNVRGCRGDPGIAAADNRLRGLAILTTSIDISCRSRPKNRATRASFHLRISRQEVFGRREQFIAKLKELQNALGNLNDIVVHEGLARVAIASPHAGARRRGPPALRPRGGSLRSSHATSRTPIPASPKSRRSGVSSFSGMRAAHGFHCSRRTPSLLANPLTT